MAALTDAAPPSRRQQKHCWVPDAWSCPDPQRCVRCDCATASPSTPSVGFVNFILDNQAADLDGEDVQDGEEDVADKWLLVGCSRPYQYQPLVQCDEEVEQEEESVDHEDEGENEDEFSVLLLEEKTTIPFPIDDNRQQYEVKATTETKKKRKKKGDLSSSDDSSSSSSSSSGSSDSDDSSSSSDTSDSSDSSSTSSSSSDDSSSSSTDSSDSSTSSDSTSSVSSVDNSKKKKKRKHQSNASHKKQGLNPNGTDPELVVSSTQGNMYDDVCAVSSIMENITNGNGIEAPAVVEVDGDDDVCAVSSVMENIANEKGIEAPAIVYDDDDDDDDDDVCVVSSMVENTTNANEIEAPAVAANSDEEDYKSCEDSPSETPVSNFVFRMPSPSETFVFKMPNPPKYESVDEDLHKIGETNRKQYQQNR